MDFCVELICSMRDSTARASTARSFTARASTARSSTARSSPTLRREWRVFGASPTDRDYGRIANVVVKGAINGVNKPLSSIQSEIHGDLGSGRYGACHLIEAGLHRRFSTLTGSLPAFGHEVTMQVAGLSYQTTVYF